MGQQNATSKPNVHSSKTTHRHRQHTIEQEVQVFWGVEEANEPVQIRQLMPAFSWSQIWNLTWKMGVIILTMNMGALMRSKLKLLLLRPTSLLIMKIRSS